MTKHYEFPGDDWSEIQRLLRPHIGNGKTTGEILCALVGGSQVLRDENNRPLAIPGKSDTDVLIIADYVPYPLSITAMINGQKYDLILRDPQTLAFDFMQDRYTGRGTLAKIASTGEIAWGDERIGTQIKAWASDVYAQGPYAVTYETARQWADTMNTNIFNSLNQPENHRIIAGLAIAHDIAVGAFRVLGRWSGKGKMIPRLLPNEHREEIVGGLIDGFNEYAQGGTSNTFHHILNNLIMPLYTDASGPQVPFRVKFLKHPVPTSEEERSDALSAAFTNARCTIDKTGLAHLLKDGSPYERIGAQAWLYSQWSNSASAVSRYRKARSEDEFFFAVAKQVKLVLGHHEIIQKIDVVPWRRNTMWHRRYHHSSHREWSLETVTRSALAKNYLPRLAHLVLRALDGYPEMLVDKSAELRIYLCGQQDKARFFNFPRTSPQYCRAGVGHPNILSKDK